MGSKAIHNLVDQSGKKSLNKTNSNSLLQQISLNMTGDVEKTVQLSKFFFFEKNY